MRELYTQYEGKFCQLRTAALKAALQKHSSACLARHVCQCRGCRQALLGEIPLQQMISLGLVDQESSDHRSC